MTRCSVAFFFFLLATVPLWHAWNFEQKTTKYGKLTMIFQSLID